MTLYFHFTVCLHGMVRLLHSRPVCITRQLLGAGCSLHNFTISGRSTQLICTRKMCISCGRVLSWLWMWIKERWCGETWSDNKLEEWEQVAKLFSINGGTRTVTVPTDMSKSRDKKLKSYLSTSFTLQGVPQNGSWTKHPGHSSTSSNSEYWCFDWRFSWFSSVSFGKRWDKALDH